MKIAFKKYHGLGNDFIIFDGRRKSVSLNAQQVQILCDRHLGIGADGVLVLRTGNEAPYWMILHNADGSPAEISGNGLRCFLLFLRDIGKDISKPIRIETAAEIVKTEFISDERIRVWMPRPDFGVSGAVTRQLKAGEMSFDCVTLSVGNPHCVIFGPPRDEFFAKTYGPIIEKSDIFPTRTNVEFAHVISDTSCRLVVWERGAGLTLACGSGATATVIAGVATGKLRADSPVTVSQLGGDLQLIVKEDYSEIILEGPARFVFAGEIII